MKWTTPAFVLAPAFILALAPVGFVVGQSSSSNFERLAPGPIAELLPEDGPNPYSGLELDVVQPPGQNGSVNSFNQPAEAPQVNPLPPATAPTANRTPQTETRGSLIKEPIPYNQVPQIQSDMYSLEDTFTLPRTPVKTTPRATSEATIAAPVYSSTQEVVYQPTVATPMAQIQMGGTECTTCEEAFVQPCDVCNECESSEIIIDDCGCGECESSETVPCSDGYFETEQHGYAVQDDTSGRTIKQGLISRHLQKHCGLKQEPEHCGPEAAACDFTSGDSCYPIAAGGTAGCNDVYEPVVDPTDVRTNTLLNVSGVYFNRNLPDVLLSAERVPAGGTPSRFLSTDDADFDGFGGIDASIIRRRETGKGIELRYLGFSPGQVSRQLAGSPVTLVGQFGNIGQAGGITHQDAFNLSEIHEISRDMEIQNAEFNFLRMGRLATTRRGQTASFEYLLGFRYFNFEESLTYSGFGIRPNTLPGGDITRADYRSEVENELYGAQFGGRSEISLFNRMSLLVGLKAGIFANDFSSRQRATVRGIGGEERTATVIGGPNDGAPFDFTGEDTDYTLLGEIDLGLTYQLTNNVRVRGGYKAIFVDDIALADTQAAGDFRDLNFISQPTVNDDLVLYGGYLGLDVAF